MALKKWNTNSCLEYSVLLTYFIYALKIYPRKNYMTVETLS